MTNNDSSSVKKWTTIETDGKGKAKMDDIVLCFPVVRQDMILDALKSLREHTKSCSYKAIVVNMSIPNREFEDALYNLSDIVIRTHRNYGFAQGANLAMRLAPSPYICVCNDDVVFLPTEPDWFAGCLETFNRFETAAAVNMMSPKEPGWGWGEPDYRYLIPEAFMSFHVKSLYDEDRKRMQRVKEAKSHWDSRGNGTYSDSQIAHMSAELELASEDFQVTQNELESVVFELSHDPAFIQALVEEKNWMVVDAFACWGTVFRADRLAEVGMFDESWTPGGGDDYDEMARIYQKSYRALSTSRAWCWHKWGMTKGSPSGFNTALPLARPPWNKLSVKGFGEDGAWDYNCNVWGKDCVRVNPNVYRAPL